MRNYWKRLLAAALLVIVAACLLYEGIYYIRLNQKEKLFASLRVEAEIQFPEESTEESAEEVQYVEPVYDFDVLREQNDDVYAWIVVPGTQVDYPVLQSETDNYYLEHNLDNSSGYPGCLYTNKCNLTDFSDYNTVIYGHNMKNGSMFGCLHSFEDEEFFEENRQIIVYTEEKRLTYEIYAAVKFTDYYIPAYYDVTTATGKGIFLNALTEESEGSEVSHIREDMEILTEDRIITLSTCVNGESDKRWLIVGRLVSEDLYAQE